MNKTTLNILLGILITATFLLSYNVGYNHGKENVINNLKSTTLEDDPLVRYIDLYFNNEVRVGDSGFHVCAENPKTHNDCVYDCPCRGSQCTTTRRDYQILLHEDTVWLYDETRVVGSYIGMYPTSKIDSMIDLDNR